MFNWTMSALRSMDCYPQQIDKEEPSHLFRAGWARLNLERTVGHQLEVDPRSGDYHEEEEPQPGVVDSNGYWIADETDHTHAIECGKQRIYYGRGATECSDEDDGVLLPIEPEHDYGYNHSNNHTQNPNQESCIQVASVPA